ncbi:MAG: cytochrome c maturation protein CcmE [Candidatus Heimdallarchaeota archaeon]
MPRKSIKLAIGGIILVVASFAIYLSMSSFVNPYVTVSELQQDPSAYQGKNIQIVGVVESGSLSYSDLITTFILQDFEHSNDSIQITYRDVPPTGLQENQKIVAIGQLISTGEFEAQKLLMQCPSKYE